MRLLNGIDFTHYPIDSPDEVDQYEAWSAWAEDPLHISKLAHATDVDVADELAAISCLSHEEAGSCIDFLCHALLPVTSPGLQLPEPNGPVIRLEPEWRERELTPQEASHLEDVVNILLRQAQRTETPGYDPDADFDEDGQTEQF